MFKRAFGTRSIGGWAGACTVVFLVTAGCGQATIDLPAGGAAETRPADAEAGWGSVLKQYLKGGQMYYFGLAERPQAMQWYMARLAKHGPDATPGAFPTPADRLAYWLNAHNASAVWAGLACHRTRQAMPRARRSRATPAPPFECVVFDVDGRRMTLTEMAAEAWKLRPDDIRLATALSDGSASSTAPPAEPFRAAGLDEQLEAQWQSALCDPQVTRIDHTRQTLYVLPDIYDRKDQLVGRFQKRFDTNLADLHTALLWMADGKARRWLNRAIGYHVAPSPADHSLRQLVHYWDDP